MLGESQIAHGLSAEEAEARMRKYANLNGGRWRKLNEAIDEIGYQWEGTAHRALSDTLACRAVWNTRVWAL